jgi:hypothetical protein
VIEDKRMASAIYDDLRDQLILSNDRRAVLPAQNYEAALKKKEEKEAEERRKTEERRRRREAERKEAEERRRSKEEERRRRKEAEERKRRKEAEERKRKEAEERKRKEEERRWRKEEEKIRKLLLTPPPKQVTGSTGSRVKLLLGTSGVDYVLFLDESDGLSEWQSPSWSTGKGSLPSGLALQVNECAAQGRHITNVAFGQSGEWFVSAKKRNRTGACSWWGDVDAIASDQIGEYAAAAPRLQVSFGNETNRVLLVSGNNGYWTTGVDHDLQARLNSINQSKHTIEVARLFSNGGYFIGSEGTVTWKALGAHLANEVKSGRNEGISDVARAHDGSWVVIRPDRFIASAGVSQELTTRLTLFYQMQKNRVLLRENTIRAFHADQKALLVELTRLERKRAERARQEQQREKAQAEKKATERRMEMSGRAVQRQSEEEILGKRRFLRTM